MLNLSTELGIIDDKHLVGSMHDRASVNKKAMQTLKKYLSQCSRYWIILPHPGSLVCQFLHTHLQDGGLTNTEYHIYVSRIINVEYLHVGAV